MNSRNTRCALAVGLIALLLAFSGCAMFSRDYHEAKTYDLKVTGSSQLPVQLKRLRNLSGTDIRFWSQLDAVQVASDEYARWRLSPDMMLERAVMEYFRPDAATYEIDMNAVLTRFEFDLVSHQAVFSWQVQLTCKDQTVKTTGRFTAPIDGDRPDDAAAAMSRCLDQALADVAAKAAQLVPAADAK